MSITILRITFFIVPVFFINSCALSVPKDHSPLLEYTLFLESSEGNGGNARCFANLDNGLPYTAEELQANGIKPAFKYSYITDGASYNRFLVPMHCSMGNPDSASLSEWQFDEIRTGGDMKRIVNASYISWLQSDKLFISSILNDERVGNNIIALSANSGTRYGFMRIERYEPRPAAGSPAIISIRIKMQP